MPEEKSEEIEVCKVENPLLVLYKEDLL